MTAKKATTTTLLTTAGDDAEVAVVVESCTDVVAVVGWVAVVGV